MDVARPSGVTFHGVADRYFIELGVSISCNYTVEPCITSAVRDWVGIFPDGWQASKDCILYKFAPLPTEYQPDQAVDCCVSFDGDKLATSVRQPITCRFCYISGTNRVEGMSTSFQLVPGPEMMSSSAFLSTSRAPMSCDNSEDTDDDFVEIEDEDGEIVVIKSRSTFLEEELAKAVATAQSREDELVNEKRTLLLQLDSAQNELQRLLEENQTLHLMLADAERQKSAELAEQQRKFDAIAQELNMTRRALDDARREMSALLQRGGEHHRASESGAAADEFHNVMTRSLHEDVPHDDMPWAADGAAVASPESVAHDIIVGRAVSRPRQIPLRGGAAASADNQLPDVITCSANSPSGCGASGIMSSPSSGRPVLTKLGWKDKISGVGLNMFCHLRNAMDPFGVDQFGSAEGMDDISDADLSPPVTFPRSHDGSGTSSHRHHGSGGTEPQPPAILRPPTSSACRYPPTSVVVHCPFCQAPLYPSASVTGASAQEQLVEHILRNNCGAKTGPAPSAAR